MDAASDASAQWRNLFQNWPESMPKHGLLITTFNEGISFVNFLVSPGILIMERDRPDSSNSRKVMISFSAISALKLSDPGDLNRYQVMGFQLVQKGAAKPAPAK